MAGTDRRNKIEFAPSPAIILCEPQLGENIGTAARAMANFGLWDLRLVNPREGWPNDKAKSAAAKADHVIERAKIFDNVQDAIGDLNLVLATTARKRDMFKNVIGPDEAALKLVEVIKGGARGGILFGRERWGLNNQEIALSDIIVTLPADPAFASLNIAQAVLILAYEWRKISKIDKPLPFEGNLGVPSKKSDYLAMFEHLEGALERANFFMVKEKRPSMVTNIRNMLNRANFNEQELRTFRGIISALERGKKKE